MTRADHHPSVLLERARAGDAEALGQLLQLYRNYLQIMAHSLIGPDLRAASPRRTSFRRRTWKRTATSPGSSAPPSPSF